MNLTHSQSGRSGLTPMIDSRPLGFARLIQGVAAVAIAAASAPAFAEGPGWTANSTVVKLVVTYNGGVNVRLSPDRTACVSQSGYGPNFASIYLAHPGINKMKADLLTAYLTGKPVALYFSDSTCRVEELILGG